MCEKLQELAEKQALVGQTLWTQTNFELPIIRQGVI